MTRHLALLLILLALARPGLAETTLFCLEGEFDLGGRYQGLTPQAGEFHALSWCVVTESSSERVHFTGRGKSNPDLDSTWTVALTHLHDDHAGGARAFAAEGARVYAPAGIEGFLEQALNRPNMPPDRLSRSGSSIDIVPVLAPVTIGQGKGQVRLVSLGPGPHVDDLVGLWAPDPGYFFVSDVHVPRSDSTAPRAERAATECWFARKVVSLLPESTLVVNSHSGIMTPVSRLRLYLLSESCLD